MKPSKRAIKFINETFYPGYNDFEINAMQIMEMRGLASFGLQDVVEEMYDYCCNYIKNNYPNLKDKYQSGNIRSTGEDVKIYKYSIVIPKEITNKFTEFINFNVTVNVTDIICKKFLPSTFAGDGNTELKKYNELDNEDKLIDCNIIISCYAKNNQVLFHQFFEAFNHEYNHAIEQKKREVNKKYDTNIRSSFDDFMYKKTNNRHQLLNDSDIENKSFGWILYMLWSKTEFNAWATSAYSFLKSINSERREFVDDIKKSEVYIYYNDLKNKYIPTIKDCKSLRKWVYIYNILNKDEIDLNMESNKTELKKRIINFKKSFIKRTEYLLERFWIKTCRTASLWYEEKNELDKKNKNGTITRKDN